jgi:hypothetical protein
MKASTCNKCRLFLGLFERELIQYVSIYGHRQAIYIRSYYSVFRLQKFLIFKML